MFAAVFQTTSHPSAIVLILKISKRPESAVDGVTIDFPAIGILQGSN